MKKIMCLKKTLSLGSQVLMKASLWISFSFHSQKGIIQSPVHQKPLGFQAHCRAKPRQLHHEWSSTPAGIVGRFLTFESPKKLLETMSCLGWPYAVVSPCSAYAPLQYKEQRPGSQGRNPSGFFPGITRETPCLQRMACRARGKKLEEMSPWTVHPPNAGGQFCRYINPTQKSRCFQKWWVFSPNHPF